MKCCAKVPGWYIVAGKTTKLIIWWQAEKPIHKGSGWVLQHMSVFRPNNMEKGEFCFRAQIRASALQREDVAGNRCLGVSWRGFP